MTSPINDLAVLLREMRPVLNQGTYAFCTAPVGADLSTVEPVATFREEEGLTVVVEEEEALRVGFPVLFRASWITLKVHSDLQAVGLTAAFATALGNAGISCNVIAAVHHDHIFVHVERAQAALGELLNLQRAAEMKADRPL